MTRITLLQQCLLLDAISWDTRPKDDSLRDKLFGDPEALRRIAAFVRMTGFSVWPSKKKNKKINKNKKNKTITTTTTTTTKKKKTMKKTTTTKKKKKKETA